MAVGDTYFGHDHAGDVRTVTVKSGTLVRWIWVGSGRHNVTVISGPQRFHSKTQTAGTYLARPRKRGTYTIIRTIHGREDPSMGLRVR